MTDVPGHTRGIISPLAAQGVKFLDIGVNDASTPAELPPLFVWKDTKGRLARRHVPPRLRQHRAGARLRPRRCHCGRVTIIAARTLRPRSRALLRPHPSIPQCEDHSLRPYRNRQRHRAFPQKSSHRHAGNRGHLDLRRRQRSRQSCPLSRNFAPAPLLDCERQDSSPATPPTLLFSDDFCSKRSTPGAPTLKPGSTSITTSRAIWPRCSTRRTTKSSSSAGPRSARTCSTESPRSPLHCATKLRMPFTLSPRNRRSFPAHRRFPLERKLRPLISSSQWIPAAGPSIACAIRRRDASGPLAEHPLALISYQTLSPADYARFFANYIISTADWAKKDFGKPNIERFGAESREWQPTVSNIEFTDDGKNYHLLAKPRDPRRRGFCFRPRCVSAKDVSRADVAQRRTYHLSRFFLVSQARDPHARGALAHLQP